MEELLINVVGFFPFLAEQTSGQPVSGELPFLFYLCALLTCLSAWAIVVSQSIVRMSVFLLLTLAGVAGLYFILSAEFLGAIQMIVYAGGTLILIVFGVMLTSKNPFLQLRATPVELGLGIGLGLVIAAILMFSLIHTTLPETDSVGLGSGYGQVHAIGRGLLSRYLVPFELSAVLLLVVMIGAAYMARRRVGQ